MPSGGDDIENYLPPPSLEINKACLDWGKAAEQDVKEAMSLFYEGYRELWE